LPIVPLGPYHQPLLDDLASVVDRVLVLALVSPT